MRKLNLVRSVLFALMLMCLSAVSFAQIGVSVSFGPPALPVYEQPICPGDGYIWTPGYWAWDGGDYYWVPGTWVESPEVGYLWTPGYWGWGESAYFFHEGYWGPHVGYYGGIDYGFGYGGHGYEGGRWENNHFYYNTSVNRINNTNIHNTYNTRVEYNSGNRVSYNGGNGGINQRPSSQEQGYDRERHTGPVAAQNEHMQQARSNPELRASTNQGKPPIAATSRPGDFKGSAVPAKEAGAPYKAPERPAAGNEARPANGAAHVNANSHASEVQPHNYTAPTTGKPATDQKYQQQQTNLAAKQNQEHQKLQQQQEKEHQQAAKKNTSEPQKQQMEQHHTQQTQQLEQKHTVQLQKVETHQQPHQSAPPPQSHPEPEKH
jgi:hypothetical protein